MKEGRDNEKFDSLPEKRRAWLAYRILHNPFYYWLALILAVGVMLLAILEEPSTFTQKTERSEKAVSTASDDVDNTLLLGASSVRDDSSIFFHSKFGLTILVARP